MTLLELSRPYSAVGGTPTISRVDPVIFTLRYFTKCLECSCGDWCCSWGVDVDLENVERLRAHQVGIEAFTGVAMERWFDGVVQSDPDYPGGGNMRIRAENDACVFLDRGQWGGRGCMLHRYALHASIDYHEVKPLMSSLFPLSFDAEHTLHAAGEVEDDELVCLDRGPTLYRGARDELLHYFGAEFVAELDALERTLPEAPKPEKKHRLSVVR